MKIIEGIDSKILMNSHLKNLIHHQKYNQVMEPQQLIVQIAKIRNTKWRSQCSGTGFRLIPIEADHGSWKAI